MSTAIDSLDTLALVPNYHALAVWILTGCPLDKALEKFGLKIADQSMQHQGM